jgi:predicted nucleotidyltransferase
MGKSTNRQIGKSQIENRKHLHCTAQVQVSANCGPAGGRISNVMTLEATYTQLNKEALEAQLFDIRARLAEMGVQKAILFGSLARDQVTPFSDLDLIIVQETDARFLDRLEAFYTGLELRVDADILVYTPKEWAELQTWNHFIQQVAREGEVIYEAEST